MLSRKDDTKNRTKILQTGTGIAFAVLLIASAFTVAGFVKMPAASATFAGENGKIAFVSDRDGNDEIYVMNADGTGQTRLTNNTAIDSMPDWSPDNRKIAFVSDRDGNDEIYVMNADGTGEINLTNDEASDSSPSWSPDGTKVVFESDRAGTTGVYVMNADGTGQTQLIEDGRHPSWSPDGTRIAFISGEWGDGPSLIHIMNADGSSPVRLDYDPATLQFPGPDPPNNPTRSGWEHWPDWSPDGTKITFTGEEVGPSIYSISIDGTDFMRLSGQWELYSSWSPDGTKVVFTRSFSGPNPEDYEIYTISSSGNIETLTRLTFNDAEDEFPDWGSAPNTTDSSEWELTVNAVDIQGNSLSGMWTTIRTDEGMLVKSGFTPLIFVGKAGIYEVSVADYDGMTFRYWTHTGTPSRSNTIALTSDTTLTAIYNIGDTLRGFTSLTYTGTEEQPELTVNAFSLADGHDLHMWTLIDPQSTDSSGTTYKVYASNYKDRVFDHWEDGSTDRVRTLTIEEATTITAYYQTG